jgi:hypothetical protein
MTVVSKPAQRLRRRKRVRSKVSGSPERPRLSVFRSNRGLFAQLIDDRTGKTVAAVNWIEADLRKLGRLAARRAREGRGRHELRLRSRRLPLPRAGQGARRGCPRGRPRVLNSLLSLIA